MKNFFARPTRYCCICNGCQVIYGIRLGQSRNNIPMAKNDLLNDSLKHESNFTSVVIQKNNSVIAFFFRRRLN